MLPVSAEQARPLCQLARLALHGQGARTVIDRAVRETWEVPKQPVRTDELCSFLAGPKRASLEWPLAERRRQHLHHRVDTAELPVRHGAHRTARPYKLALTKTGVLFEHELRKRDDDRQDLVWIEGWRLGGRGALCRVAQILARVDEDG